MNAAEIKEKYSIDAIDDRLYFLYENGDGKQCRVHTSSGQKGDDYVVYASNEWVGYDKKKADIAYRKLKEAVQKYAKKNDYVVPAFKNDYDMEFVLKKKPDAGAKKSSSSVADKKAMEKKIDKICADFERVREKTRRDLKALDEEYRQKFGTKYWHSEY